MNFSTKKLFSSRDDAHLVEYLSDFDAGRKGTRLYRDLVDNPTQWPWSSRHPWQSWRDRYVRKSDDFERMIRFHKNKARLVETAPALTSSEPHLLNSKRKADLEPEDTRQEKRPRINAEQSSNSTKRALPSSQTAAGPSGTQDKSFPLLTPAEALNIVSKLRFVQIDTSKSHRKPTISSDKGEGSSRANAPTRRRPLWKKPWITPVPESTILDLDQPLVSQRSQTSNGDFRNRPSPERAAPPRTEGLSHAVESNPDNNASRIQLGDENDTTMPVHSSPADEHNVSPPFSSSPNDTWLSASDQHQLIDMMVTSMMAEYQLPADQILRVWKKSGGLQKAAAALKELTESNGEASSKIVTPISTLPAHNSPIGREDDGHTVASKPTIPVHNSPLDDAAVINANGVSNVVPRDAAIPPRTPEPQIRQARSPSPTASDTSSTSSTSSAADDHPPSPNGDSSRNPKDADHPPAAQTAQIPMPFEFKKVYAQISSPGRKDVLQRFWARYGQDFLQVEHTLKSWNSTTA